ncbi:MAG: CDP-archaeol synthase [Pseudomonadota bacterium]
MLKQRVITAVVLMLVLLSVLFLLPPLAFELLVTVVLAAGAWEWTALSGVSSRSQSMLYVGVLFTLGFVLVHLPPAMMPLLLGTAVLWWLLAFVFVLRFPAPNPLLRHRLFLLLAGVFVLLPSWFALLYLERLPGNRNFYVLWFIALVAAADIGAYFSGKTFGRRKLAPAVSPNKTWEGFVGGVVMTCVVAILGARLGPVVALHAVNIALLLAAGLVLALVSVVGDLFESMLKRLQNMKDSGNLLPGHGGVMDRLDSITAALPLYVLLLILVLQP